METNLQLAIRLLRDWRDDPDGKPKFNMVKFATEPTKAHPCGSKCCALGYLGMQLEMIKRGFETLYGDVRVHGRSLMHAQADFFQISLKKHAHIFYEHGDREEDVYFTLDEIIKALEELEWENEKALLIKHHL